MHNHPAQGQYCLRRPSAIFIKTMPDPAQLPRPVWTKIDANSITLCCLRIAQRHQMPAANSFSLPHSKYNQSQDTSSSLHNLPFGCIFWHIFIVNGAMGCEPCTTIVSRNKADIRLHLTGPEPPAGGSICQGLGLGS